jgi:predicted transcriptional regulator
MPRIRKLEAQAKQIVASYENANFTIRKLAEVHNVSPGTIRNILRREGALLRKRGRSPKSKQGEVNG